MAGAKRLRGRIEAAAANLWWTPRRTLPAQLLRPLAWVFGASAALRRAAYRRGWLRTEQAPVPLVIVGNLIVGGAGKTPTVIALVQRLRALGFSPGVISRGHGRAGDAALAVEADSPASLAGDEALLIRRRTAAPTWVARQRIDAARRLCATHPEVDVLVADDGLQHLALARDAAIIVFDERGVGNGLLLPAGPLRERLPEQVPARSLVLYNAAQASTRLPGALLGPRLSGFVALQHWWQGAAPDRQAWQELHGREVLAVAGIARPQRFFDMLREAGLRLRELPLADHFDFGTLPWAAGEADVVVTEKDAVKLPRQIAGPTRVWVATLDFDLPESAVAALLQNLKTAPRR